MKKDVRLRAYLSGRVAEEIVFGDVSTGAENNLEQATAFADKLPRDEQWLTTGRRRGAFSAVLMLS